MADKQYLLTTPYSQDTNCTINYLHTDSEALHLQNKKLRGVNWEWYDKPITYKLNKLGYRMDKELEDINFNNYFAFFGCSYTAGIGLPKEDTFAHKISNHYGKDCVNAAIGGSGTEFVLHNFVQLLTDAPVAPKAVIINWPDACRGLYWYKGNLHNFVPGYKGRLSDYIWKEVAGYWDEAFEKTAMEVSHIVNRFKFIRATIQLICRQKQIPLFETGFLQFYPEIDTQGIHIIDWVKDFGRDIWLDNENGHPGPYFHDAVYNQFCKFIQNNQLTLA